MSVRVVIPLRWREDGALDSVTGVRVELFGSLGATGHGHGSEAAVMLGLMGEVPDRVDPRAVQGQVGGKLSHRRRLLLVLD